MEAERWQRLNDVFHEALSRDPAERSGWIALACARDPALGRDVEELLAAHERTGLDSAASDWLTMTPVEDTSPSLIGRRFGAYQVIDEIGRGGMGTVLFAERVDGQFDQRVAIKLIKRGMDTAQILDRFRAERQILASLDHPHIARLLDGGTTEDGLPYFVMEYIEGQRIDWYADEQELSVRQRLELFLHVCDAVSYAHQHLVVHRDIKPQNILVTRQGVPKLLDFGIAKVLQEGSDQGTLTVSGSQMMTPDYASPEQIDGHATTTLTDVYSLGVVLYELLTGRSPYRPRTWSAPEVCAAVRTADVDRPSAVAGRPVGDDTNSRRPPHPERVTTQAPGTLDHLRAQLSGDMDAIVLMALRKEPGRRYASVEQFATDIRLHLDGLPVRARVDSLWYRGAKFVRRNRLAVTAAGLIAVTVIGGAVATAWQAREARRQTRLAQASQQTAERRFSEIRKLAHTMLFDYHDAIKDLPGATPVRERLVRDALDYLNRLSSEAGADESLQRELALAYRKVAQVQGGSTKSNLGDTKGAIDSYLKGLAIFERLAAQQPRDRETQRELVEFLTDLANTVWETGDLPQALAHSGRARTVAESLVGDAPPDQNLRSTLARAYDVSGVLELEAGKTAEALDAHRRQLRLLESAPAADKQDPQVRRALSVAYQHMADAEVASGDLGDALESHRQSFALRTELSAEFPNNADYRRLVGTSQFYTGDVLAKMGRTREALGAFRRSLAIGEELAAADPQAHTSDLAYGHVQIGVMLTRLGNYADALPSFRRARAIREADVKADPGSLWKHASLIDSDVNICGTLARLARHGEASTVCADTATRMNQTPVDPMNAAIRTFFAESYAALGDAYWTLGGGERSAPTEERAYTHRAREMYRRSLDIWSDLAGRAILAASAADKPATVARALARVEAALRD